VRTVSSQKSTLRLLMGGKAKSGSVLTPFGPVRAGLITTQSHSIQKENLDRELTVLLNSLEKGLAELTSKYYEACDTYITVTHRLVTLTGTPSREVGTKC
jgi:hypothetical protein